MVPVTVTSAATDPVCIGAVPLPFSSESASAKLRSTAPPLVVIEAAPFDLGVTRCQCRSNRRRVVNNIVGRTKHARCLRHADVISHSHVGRDRSRLRGRSPVAVQQRIRVREAQVNRAAVGSNRSRTVYLSVTRCQCRSDSCRVINNIVGRTKHARCLGHTDRASHSHVGRDRSRLRRRSPVAIQQGIRVREAQVARTTVGSNSAAPFTSALPAVSAPATVAASSKMS